jgi:hypothetical protein
MGKKAKDEVRNSDKPLAESPKPRVLSWEDSIKNPENREFVQEVAFDKYGCNPCTDRDLKKVTQKDFNKRYGIE